MREHTLPARDLLGVLPRRPNRSLLYIVLYAYYIPVIRGIAE